MVVRFHRLPFVRQGLYTGRAYITVYIQVAIKQATEHSLVPPSHLTSQALQLGTVLQHPVYMCARNLNSTPHVCAAITLPTNTPNFYFFKKYLFLFFVCVVNECRCPQR